MREKESDYPNDLYTSPAGALHDAAHRHKQKLLEPMTRTALEELYRAAAESGCYEKEMWLDPEVAARMRTLGLRVSTQGDVEQHGTYCYTVSWK